MADLDAFDPRPLRVAVVIAVLVLVLPGTGEGAALLWTFAGGASPVPLVAPSTHAMLQLGGGFMIFIQAFLALGVPHMLGLDARRARAIVVPIVVIAAALVATVAAEQTGDVYAVIAARIVAFAGALGAALVFVLAHEPGRGLRDLPVPVLVFALVVHPGAWLVFVLEAAGRAPAGVAGEALLFVVVTPVIMAMGWKMFSAMLQLETPRRAPLVAAIGCWLAGGALVVASRFDVARGAQLVAAALLFAGAVAWLASLHALRRRGRAGKLPLHGAAGPELRAAVVSAAACLVLAPIVWAGALLLDAPALVDVARHLVAVGFVFLVTMGVTLRALPRFCRGRPSSTWLALASLALVLLGLALRFARALPDGAPLVRASAVLTLAGVALWGAHLVRGLVPARASAANPGR